MNTKPQNISDLIAQVESNNNQYALRFEPAYNPHALNVTDYAKRHNVSQATARMCLASSWGLYQIMGDNLYSYGLQISLPNYACSVQVQKLYFTTFLTRNNLYNLTADYQNFISSDDNLAEFAKVYNGPGNVDAYVQRMKEFI